MTLNSNTAHVLPYHDQFELASDIAEFDDDIVEIISMHQPIMAKDIASLLSAMHKSNYSRREINSRLYKRLFRYLAQDEYFRWSLTGRNIGYPGYGEDPEKESYSEDWGAVNLDSTARIRYARGQELTIQFTKVNSPLSIEPEAGITYVFYKSPLAMALLARKAGDICYLPGGSCMIIEIID